MCVCVSLQYDKTRLAVYEVEDAASILVELMAVYRDKGLIFSKTCTLLGILALDSNIRNVRDFSRDSSQRLENANSFYLMQITKKHASNKS